MDRNTAQLNQDYGVQVGTVGGIPVLAPENPVTDGAKYNIVYNESLNAYRLEVVEA